MELKPQRVSAKRQKVVDKIKPPWCEAKGGAEIQKVLASYKNKEYGEVSE